MPYASEAQRRFFHTGTARQHGITAADVHEWDKASKGKRLPERVEKRASPTGGRPPVAKAPQPPKPPSFTKQKAPQAERPMVQEAQLAPGPLRDQVAAHGSDAAVGATDRVFGNNSVTMPVTQT
jgi:hypothetical protein